MNYGTGEEEVVQRLNDYISELQKSDKYEAALMPETEQGYKDFYAKFTKARVAIQYVDSLYNPSNATGLIRQEEKVRFRLTFESRKLRGDGGLYNLIEIVKLALIGYQLSDCDRLSVSKYGMLEYEQNAWQPYLEFECNTLNVQKANIVEEAFGPFSQISLTQDFNG